MRVEALSLVRGSRIKVQSLKFAGQLALQKARIICF